MSSLPTPLRRQLENTVKQAHKIAEGGARKALEALAVHEPEAYQHMDEAQRGLRRKLRAQAKQLGDVENQTRRGAYEIKHLVEKLAYDQWHRLLFARFLLENNLLISAEHGVSVSLDDCEDLAPSFGLKDGWAAAARFAAKELPEIFRVDDPAGAVELSVEDRKPLIQLVTGLPVEVFTARDSLGWCYQFWQAERKDEVNAAGNKIGANELAAVTQLFTEDYMVDFLLDNTLGAWHAGKVLIAEPTLANNGESEEDLRKAVALPSVRWKYLRFIKSKDGSWTPAAGTFDGWPQTARELKCLDPCMGSGHFVVAMFERLVALRMAEEALDDSDAVAAVISDNLFGLELDPRCTQIGAFNLAIAAWRHAGHCTLPPMNLACSGLAPNAMKEDWLKLAAEDDRFQRGMSRLYTLFKDAPVLGSLINPRAGGGDLLEADFNELQPLLAEALAQEISDDIVHEMAITAHGLAKAAEILAGQFTLIATNVPYLGRNKQDDTLIDYCERIHPLSKTDLATCFVERCVTLCGIGGSLALVTPQSWLFLGSYTKLRKKMLTECEWNTVARLGESGFESAQAAGAFTALLAISRHPPAADQLFSGLDVADEETPKQKDTALLRTPLAVVVQKNQTLNPDCRVSFGGESSAALLSKYAKTFEGLTTGDLDRFVQLFWEQPRRQNGWEFFIGSPNESLDYCAREQIILWENGAGALANSGSSYIKGEGAWGQAGLRISQTRNLVPTIYSGELFDKNAATLIPGASQHLAAIYCFAQSEAFTKEVRRIDQSLKVTIGTLVKIPFELAHWQKAATEKYAHGLPKPFSSDPTQWLFNGHPKGSDQPLHVAVARLLGYRWPRQTGSSFPDCPALGPDGLEELGDGDGIVCLSATKGEAPAAERLRELLARAWGKDWNATVLEDLLAQAGFAGKTLDGWLRNGFFEQHCALFHHRPFLWHLWDGQKNGFNVLVNYHQLTHANLEKLTYAYLGDWIRRQQAAVDAGEAGSDARLQAARQLQSRLKLILEGEPPYDLFVRWKPLSKQAIGWDPDINDGVRLNIRPFLTQDTPGGKKGAGLLRTRPNIKWEKDRGKEPVRAKKDFPWFWGWDEEKKDFAGVGQEPDGNRWNDCHYTNDIKRRARSE